MVCGRAWVRITVRVMVGVRSRVSPVRLGFGLEQTTLAQFLIVLADSRPRVNTMLYGHL